VFTWRAKLCTNSGKKHTFAQVGGKPACVLAFLPRHFSQDTLMIRTNSFWTVNSHDAFVIKLQCCHSKVDNFATFKEVEVHAINSTFWKEK